MSCRDTWITCRAAGQLWVAVAVWCGAAGLQRGDSHAAVPGLFLGYDDSKLDALGEHIGFVDTVTVEQLATAGVPNRTVFDVRQRLDPLAVAAQVLCQCLPLLAVVGVQDVVSLLGWLVAPFSPRPLE